MANEIERKFLVNLKHLSPLKGLLRREIEQFYLPSLPGFSERVRSEYGIPGGVLCKKQQVSSIENIEIEIFITDTDVSALRELQVGIDIRKTRFELPFGKDGLKWELDFFKDHYKGIVVAEIEIPHKDYDLGTLPKWILREITNEGLSNKAMALDIEKCKAKFEKLIK